MDDMTLLREAMASSAYFSRVYGPRPEFQRFEDYDGHVLYAVRVYATLPEQWSVWNVVKGKAKRVGGPYVCSFDVLREDFMVKPEPLYL